METSTNRYSAIEVLTFTDAYKLGHVQQYPAKITRVLSNFTNRGSRIDRVDHVVNFGLQYFLSHILGDAFKPFFAATEDEVAEQFEAFTTEVLGPNAIGSDHIRALHRKGYLPLKIRALPEGALVPLRVPLLTVENTDPEFFWLTNYIETVLSSSIWQPGTSATTAYYFRKMLDEWALKTAGTTAGVQWQGHDFSFRGMPGQEAAAASGAGHLLSFTGSDNLNVIPWVDKFYPGDNGLILASVAATEHSVMCAGASDAPRDEDGNIDEIETYRRLLTIYPAGIVSVVSDTYNLWTVLTDVLPRLKDQIMAREGKLVIRPDSGDPVDILTGEGEHPEALKLRAEAGEDPNARPWEKGVVELLWDVFGGTVNEQGYKVLDPHIGAIYGDSITYERGEEISRRLAAKGFASTNVVYGVGSYTYQYVTRDTFASAVKSTWVEIDGEGREIFKDPITDNGTKKSAKGRIAVIYQIDPNTGEKDYALVDGEVGAILEGTDADMLTTVWEDGQFKKVYSFAEVRENLHPEGLG